MIVDRYPTPHADRLFSRQAQIDSWMEITQHYAVKDAAERNSDDPNVFKKIHDMQPTSAASVATRESYTGHEVVAFLQIMEERNPDIKQHLHVGLTSSDLVEYAWTVATEQHARIIVDKIGVLDAALKNLPHAQRLSRTHGQVGWVTTLQKQVEPTAAALRSIESDLNRWRNVRPLKTSGPSGAYPVIGYRTVGVAAMINRKAYPSTQILHRDHLLAWAALYLRLMCTLENLALQVRLGSRSEVGEVREGAADSRAGSSAMPQKKNPIDSERVTGLARIARGNFLALSEGVALWEERDLSNSAPERIAIESMAGVAEYCLTKITSVIESLIVNVHRMDRNMDANMNWRMHVAQYALQVGAGFGPVEASQFVKDHVAITPNGRMDVEGSAFELWRDRDTLLGVLDIYSQTILQMKP